MPYQIPIRGIRPPERTTNPEVLSLLNNFQNLKNSLIQNEKLERILSDFKSEILVSTHQIVKEEILKIKEKISDIETNIKDVLSNPMNPKVIQNIVQDVLRNIKGDSGYTPIKGKDYFTQEEIEEFLEHITPQKGIHYNDGEKGENAPKVDEKALEERIYARVRQPKDGQNAIINEEKIVRKVLELIPKTKEKKEDYDKLAGIITDHLEKGKIKISKRHINDWQDAEDVFRRFVAAGSLHGGTGNIGSNWRVANLTGDINGSNKTFTVPGINTPIANSERIFLNYVEQNPLTDYSLSGKTVTYTTAPDISLSGKPHIIRFSSAT